MVDMLSITDRLGELNGINRMLVCAIVGISTLACYQLIAHNLVIKI